MYNARFRQWQVSKSYKAADKDRLAAKIAEAYLNNQHITDLSYQGRPLRLQRILRHCKSQTPHPSITTTMVRVRSHESALPHPQNGPSCLGNDHDPEKMGRVMSNSAKNETGYNLSARPASRVNQADLLQSPQTLMAQETLVNAPNTNTDQVLVTEARVLSVVNPMSFVAPMQHVEVMLLQTRTYYRWLLARCESAGPGPGHPKKTASDQALVPRQDDFPRSSPGSFWYNIKSAMYLLKKDSPQLAWPLVSQSCDLVGTILPCHPLNFLVEIFATLSPVNTAKCPQLRTQLLHFIAVMTRIKFGHTHPLTVVCGLLQADVGGGPTSRIAMNVILAMLQQHLGPTDSRALHIHRQQVVLLRREKCYIEAEKHAVLLMQTCSAKLGPGHIQTRKALSELVHIYHDCGDDYRAKELCQNSIHEGRQHLGTEWPDTHAVHEIEDMAELCEAQGDKRQSRQWLQEASAAATALWGANPSTSHILEKLVALPDSCNEGHAA